MSLRGASLSWKHFGIHHHLAAMLHVPGPADFHVHLRQGSMCELVTPHVRQGGFTLAYVMVRAFDVATRPIVCLMLLRSLI